MSTSQLLHEIGFSFIILSAKKESRVLRYDDLRLIKTVSVICFISNKSVFFFFFFFFFLLFFFLLYVYLNAKTDIGDCVSVNLNMIHVNIF